TIHFEIGEDRYLHYHSRFFEINPKKKFILIDKPSEDSEGHKPLTKRDKIAVLFKITDFRFLFHSKILGKFKYKLNKDVTIDAFKIRAPEKLLDGNRRDFFRVKTPFEQHLRIYPLPLMAKGKTSGASGVEEADCFDVMMIDISQGGTAVRTEAGLKIRAGDKVLVQFKLTKDDPDDIESEGIIKNKREPENSKDCFLGIEFIPNKDVEFKRALQRINRFIMGMQRELLAKLR
ncbi:MAG: hypothetical protein GY765_01510, partial [bacterium]|nr:hypothetical protein [bacterium]